MVYELRAHHRRNRISAYFQTRGQPPLSTDPAKARGAFYHPDTQYPLFQMGEVFQDSAVTAAILDRFIHHSRVFQMTGNTYRMKDYKLERKQLSKKKTPDDTR